MMWQRVQSCELGGTSGEGVQWTVDDQDVGWWRWTNDKSLASESYGDVFLGTIPLLGHSWGEWENFHWFKN